jgi:16S rRNA (cytosine967-C5)-methyltransferase
MSPAGARSGRPVRRSLQRPSERSRQADPGRLAAYDTLRAVATDDAYANLVLPGLLSQRRVGAQDAGFATELAYGTLRMRGLYDEVLQVCVDRPLAELDGGLLDALRLGVHQLLGMRVPAHAAVSESVALVRQRVGQGPAGLANAVLRRVAGRDAATWTAQVAPPSSTDPLGHLAVSRSHPAWIVRALREALLDRAGAGRVGGVPGAAPDPAETDGELAALLDADNLPAKVALVARPGLADVQELLDAGAELDAGAKPGRWSPWAVTWGRGDPGRLAAVRQGRAGVQDEGSQLVTAALAEVPIDGPDHRWLDLCAGPGGKAALLGALAARRGAQVSAVEVAEHRAELVRRCVDPPGLPVTVRCADGRQVGGEQPGVYDRVLVDAPCTGLGALRRRPEARWRRTPADLSSLAPLQRDLLRSALDAVRPGGVVAYVTCSPHVAETRLVVDDVLRRRADVEIVDAAPWLPVPDVGSPTGQLWPHRHGTDAMFLALLRRTG